MANGDATKIRSRQESGGTMVEFAILIALIAGIAFSAVRVFGIVLTEKYETLAQFAASGDFNPN